MAVLVSGSPKFVVKGRSLKDGTIVFMRKAIDGSPRLYFSIQTVVEVVEFPECVFYGTSNDFYNLVESIEIWGATGNIYVELKERSAMFHQRKLLLTRLGSHPLFFAE